MSREIKFRLWNIPHKKMILPDRLQLSNLISCFPLKTFQEEFEFQQFTGLKDKNGKEIYEGDWIKYELEFDYNIINHKQTKHIGTVSWDYEKTGFKPFNFEWGEKIRLNLKTLEVLSNIYENPSLIIPKKESE